jgi:type 1 glutamine amidotransferase/mono/diheme cytochrome c family protein
MRRPFALFAGLALTVSGSALAQKGWDPDTRFPALPPAEALKTYEIPPGYKLECIASEPMVEEPASFAFDGNGAMYVCEWRTYMQDEHATDQLKPVSRVVKLTDTDGDGVMDKRTVFIDEVVLPRTVLPLHDRVLVNFTGSSAVWAYFDDDKDGVSERKEIIFKGGPDNANIEHQHSGMLWNLDNTICTNSFIFKLAGGKLQSSSHDVGRISQWGLARDDDGRLFSSAAGGKNPTRWFQLPAGYPILRDLNEHGPDYAKPFSLCRVWDQSGGGYDFVNQRILTEFSAACGQTVLRSQLMPEFYGNNVVCEPVGRFLRMGRIEWNNGHGLANNVFPNSEFIRSSDAYFRPTWSETAPDGSLVFSDMYRGIIQEKEWFPIDNDRFRRVQKYGMIEVVRHGRIYRFLPQGKKPGPQPRMLDESPAELVAHLANPNGWWRDTAQMLIVSRGDKAAVPPLTKMAGEHADANARIHAMFSLQGLDALTSELVLANSAHASPRVRRAAVQLAEPWLIKGDPDLGARLGAMVTDPDAHVRIQLFLAYRRAKLEPPAELTTAPNNPIIAALLEKEQADLQRNALGRSARQGQAIFETLCATCHGNDGRGLKNITPPLANSKWFKNNGNINVLGRILLKGQTGAAAEFPEGVMVPLEHVYNDESLTDVLNFIGQKWNNWATPLPATEIKRIRAEIATRKTPFTHEEILAVSQLATAPAGAPAPTDLPAHPNPLRVLFLGDEGTHKPLERFTALNAALAPHGFKFTFITDLALVTRERLAETDVLLAYANHSDKQVPEAIIPWIRDGGALVGLHSACGNFYRSKEWFEVLGGKFKGHKSAVFAPITVDAQHPITRDLPVLEAWDETYELTQPAADRQLLQTRPPLNPGESDPQPWTWVRTEGKGRVFFSASGHDMRVWNLPAYHELVRRAILWSIGDAKAKAFSEAPRN